MQKEIEKAKKILSDICHNSKISIFYSNNEVTLKCQNYAILITANETSLLKYDKERDEFDEIELLILK